MRFVFIGPESSGKTTLTKAAQKKWGGGLVLEYAREYLTKLARDYTFEDLKTIGFSQFNMEDSVAKSNEITWCDTDYLTLHIWSKLRFQQEHQELISLWATWKRQERYYFLCAPDIPWEFDILRENPEDRDHIFDLNLSMLEKEALPYSILRGTVEARLMAIETKLEFFFQGFTSRIQG